MAQKKCLQCLHLQLNIGQKLISGLVVLFAIMVFAAC